MSVETITPNPLMVLPFVALLAAIALAPLLAPKFWHHHYPKVAIGLGCVTLAYYLGVLHAGQRVLHVGQEYVTFIVLIGSLFVVAGGIRITIKGQGTPAENVLFLLFGAVLANLVGTTGASMVLIRPWVRLNRYRVTAYHIVFFIFIVSNVGGALTPIGDPPLFLGYLKGVPFWWVAQKVWPIWLTGIGLLLGMFYVLDRRYYLRAPAHVRAAHAEAPDQWRFDGMHNVLFLLLILVAVFVTRPAFVREGLMLAAAVGSWLTTRGEIRTANGFNFEPIREVAILFVGIFATMIPALDLLEGRGRDLDLAEGQAFLQPTATTFFWGAGLLSSVLDNAPTYLSFLSAEIGSFVEPASVQQVLDSLPQGAAALALTNAPVAAVLQQYHAPALAAGTVHADHVRVAFLLADPAFARVLVALSVGAVFFGANTYIGNGPNFLVKAIAEQEKIPMPTFLGYVFKFTLPFMLPMLLIVWLVFFRG